MATSKPKRPRFMTPKGAFKYPALTAPDFGTKEYPKPDGEFKTGVILELSAPETQALIAKLMPAWHEAIAEGQQAFDALPIQARKKLGALKEQMFYEEEYSGEEGEEQPTGNVIFKFKTKFRIKDKKTGEVRENKVPLFDAKGNPLKKGVLVYGGTIGKVSFTARPYFVAGQGMAGLSFYLDGAQVIELVGPGARSAKSMGFGAEDGYDGSGDSDSDDDSPFDPDGMDSNSETDAGPRDF